MRQTKSASHRNIVVLLKEIIKQNRLKKKRIVESAMYLRFSRELSKHKSLQSCFSRVVRVGGKS